MSAADINRLVEERVLAREEFADEQVAAFWAKAAASFHDASLPGLSSDGAFQSVYTAALQATFATLAAYGLRVRSNANHYKAFYALQNLDGALRAPAIFFDELRQTRHESIYEPEHEEEEILVRLAEARGSTPAALVALRAAILTARPALANRLPQIS